MYVEEEAKGHAKTEESAKASITSLIPEVYYDLIARVPAGIVVIATILESILSALQVSAPSASTLLSASGIPVLTIAAASLGLAGIFGILLSPIADQLRALYWSRSWIAVTDQGPYRDIAAVFHQAGNHILPRVNAWSSLSSFDLHGIDRWIYDFLLMRNSIARTLLPKLRAEADLCSYLAAACLLIAPVQFCTYLLLFLSGVTKSVLWQFGDLKTWECYAASWAFAGLLCASGGYRTRRLVLRMLAMFSVVMEATGSSEEKADL